MLNPGLDVDAWVSLSYAPPLPNKDSLDPDDEISQAFLESIKNFRKNRKHKVRY